MSVKLLSEHRLEFLSLKGGCTGSSESTLVKTPHCWKSCRGSNKGPGSSGQWSRVFLRLHGCVGFSASILFSFSKNRLFDDVARI